MTFQQYQFQVKRTNRSRRWVAIKDFALNLIGTVKDEDLTLLCAGRVRLLKDLRAQLNSK